MATNELAIACLLGPAIVLAWIAVVALTWALACGRDGEQRAQRRDKRDTQEVVYRDD